MGSDCLLIIRFHMFIDLGCHKEEKREEAGSKSHDHQLSDVVILHVTTKRESFHKIQVDKSQRGNEVCEVFRKVQ